MLKVYIRGLDRPLSNREEKCTPEIMPLAIYYYAQSILSLSVLLQFLEAVKLLRKSLRKRGEQEE